MIGRVYAWNGGCWIVRARGAPFDRGPRRNVLLQRVWPIVVVIPGCAPPEQCIDGSWWWPATERVVRPFRGLRRAT